ncbi:chitin synthase-domain-containing protein [Aspergillus californicus]
MVPFERARPSYVTDLAWGNLVLTSRVHPQTVALLPNSDINEEPEFSTVRYSAITCQPSMFEEERFTLRQALFARPRRTELIITVHLCDESGATLARTLESLFTNIEFICSQRNRGPWKRHGWKKCVIYILADARAKLSADAQAVLTLLGLWQPALAVCDVLGKQVLAHLFEYTTYVGVPDKFKPQVPPRRLDVPVQMVLCVNEIYEDQISSFQWLTETILPILNPRMYAFVPIGSTLRPDAIYRLWERLNLHPKCVGVVGQMEVKTSLLTQVLNPLAAAHGFQLKLNGILDNPFKSSLGFATALVTELSMFRFDEELEALSDVESSARSGLLGPEDPNTWVIWSYYLSERRMWALEVLSMCQSQEHVDYVHKAKHYTPAVASLDEYIRRRQHYMQDRVSLALKSWTDLRSIFAGKVRGFRRLETIILLLYLSVDLLVSWFAVGNTFLIFFFINNYFTSNAIMNQHGPATEIALLTIYAFLLVLSVVCALSYQPQGKRLGRLRMLLTSGWILLATYTLFATVAIVFKTMHPTFTDSDQSLPGPLPNGRFSIAWILPLVAIYSIWIVSSSIFLEPLTVLTCGLQYVLCLLVHVNFMNIFVFMQTGSLPSEPYDYDVEDILASTMRGRNGRVPVDVGSDDELDEQYTRYVNLVSDHVDRKTLDLDEARVGKRHGLYPEKVVLAWVLSNLLLCAVILNTIPSIKKGPAGGDPENTNTGPSTLFLFVIFCLVGSLEAAKFLGTLWFFIKEAVY